MNIPSSSKSPKLKSIGLQHTIPKPLYQVNENSNPISLKEYDYQRTRPKILSVPIQEEQDKDQSFTISPTYSDIRWD